MASPLQKFYTPSFFFFKKILEGGGGAKNASIYALSGHERIEKRSEK